MKFTIDIPTAVNCEQCGERLPGVAEFDAVIFDENKVRTKAWLVCDECGCDAMFGGVFEGTE